MLTSIDANKRKYMLLGDNVSELFRMVCITIVFMYNGYSGNWLILVWAIRSRIETYSFKTGKNF